MNCAMSNNGTGRCTQRACNNRSKVQRAATVGVRLSPTIGHDLLDLHKNVDHLVNVLQLEYLCGKAPRKYVSAPRQG